MKHKNGCDGKVRHTTKEAACIAASKAKNNRLNVYHCSCGGWHVGNSNDPCRIVARIDQLLKRDALEREGRITMLRSKV